MGGWWGATRSIYLDHVLERLSDEIDAATAAVLVVAVLTTCSQTLRAAWSNPVDALRHE